MTRKLTGTSKKVKRNHTLDRRRGYVAPTDSDIKCPFFDDTFIKMGEADVADDMTAICRDCNSTTRCDYRTVIVNGYLATCNRYIKESIDGFTEKPSEAIYSPDQNVKVTYEGIRKFKDKKANVSMRVILRDNNGLFLDNVTWDDFYVDGSSAWARVPGRETETIKTTQNTNQGILSYNKPGNSELHNYTFSVISFVPVTQGDRDYLGVVFRKRGNRYYKLYWDGGDNGRILRLVFMDNGREILLWDARFYEMYPFWQKGYEYRYTIELKEDLIRFRIDNITSGYGLVERSVRDSRQLDGTFGVYAESQKDAYFYGLKGSAGKVITANEFSPLNTSTKLALMNSSTVDAELTKTMGELFGEIITEVEGIVERNIEYENMVIDRIEYQITSTNVPEGVVFDSTQTTKTTDPNSKIIISDYDYDEPFMREFEIQIAGAETNPQIHDEYFEKDATITKITVDPLAKRFQDGFNVSILSNVLYGITNVINPSYTDNLEHEVGTEETVRFTYSPNIFALEYYEGRSIDTHDKKYGIKQNVLGWHKD